MKAGSIRTRLSAALLVIVAIASGVVAVGMTVVLRAERDFRALAEDRIPAVALAGELAEFTGELAALAVQVTAGVGLTDEELAAAVTAPAEGIAEVLSAPALADSSAGTALMLAEAELRMALLGFSATGANLADLAEAELAADNQLRWTHGDVQDQAQGLLQDLSFNMDAQLEVLVGAAERDRRAAAEAVLAGDRQLRDRLQRLASETATLTALLLQARGADTQAALDQVERLGGDTLDGIALIRAGLPRRTDIALLLEGVDRLEALAQGPQGIFEQARERIALREEAVAELTRAQEALAEMQAQLTALGRGERIEAQAAADGAARAIFQGAVWLSSLTVAGVLLTAMILLFFVHHRILRRIEGLSEALTRIARGDVSASTPVPARERDEIADMARAVEVFRRSVSQLQDAHRSLSAEVAERRRAVERLEQTQRELVQAGKMAALGQMSAAISHEINQPLAAMRHRLHNLARACPEAREPIGRIEAMVERITATIGHLRRIARRSDHRRERVRLGEPLEAALALLEHRLREGRVTVERAPGTDELEVEGDEILLEQVLLNVLSNALDAIAETGRGHGTIRIAARWDENVTLTVVDDGVGLGGRGGNDLVDPFFTTKEVGKGLGLGLSIAFNVMQDMGGHLEIVQSAEAGAEVRLRLRCWQGEERKVVHG